MKSCIQIILAVHQLDNQMKISLIIFIVILSQIFIVQSISPKIYRPKLNTENILFKLSQRYNISLNFINAIWEQESNKAIKSEKGKAGEYSPFQILNIAAKDAKCKGAWRSTFSYNAECGVKYMVLGVDRCGGFYNHRIATFYNTGKCRKKPNGYSQEVMKRMLKI